MSQTPSLARVISDAIESRLTGLHTMLPGKVIKVDVASGKCDVQPLIQRLGADGLPVAIPVITNCPIGFYRAGKAAVYLPLAVGHNVEIRFCERSLDIWLTKGGTVDPEDARKHNLSDAVVYPGLYDFTQAPTGASATDLVVVNDTAKVTVKASGDVAITTSNGTLDVTKTGKFKFQGASDELLTVLISLVVKLQAVMVPTMLGPQTFLPTDIADLAAIESKLTGLKE